MQEIPYGRQDISEDDIQAVVSVLRSKFITQGPMVPRFERSVTEYCGAKHAVAVSSGTAALHLASIAMSVKPGDSIWTSPITFVASANCALYCGARIDFVDIEPDTYNLSIKHLEEKLFAAKKTGSLPKIVIPVHLAGQPCDMEAISVLSKEYGFGVIEDACHALGGRYKEDPIGNCRYSDVTVFSFHPVKTITTAEGGIALTNKPEIANRIAQLRTHGITRDPSEMTRKPEGSWYYQQVSLGFNYRMTDLQAALGFSQIKRIDRFVAKRHEIAKRYNELLKDMPVKTPWQHPGNYSGMHLYIIRLMPDLIKKAHCEVFEQMRTAGIGVNLHYIPVYLQPYYESLGFERGYCPEAERYYSEAISLPMFPGLTAKQQDRVITALQAAIKE